MRLMIVLLVIVLWSCKEKVNKEITISKLSEKSSLSVKKDTIDKKIKFKTLKSKNNFKELLKSIKNIKYTGKKHSDIRTNNTFLLDSLFEMSKEDFTVKTISYEYKNQVKFYLHTITSTNDTISIKPFLENAQGKTTMGYLNDRVLIFAMIDDNKGNYIDIPPKLNPYKLRLELVDTLYKEIKSDVIICDRWNKCVHKDFREKK